MSNPILIHISDLHISDHTGNFNNKNESSFLSSDITCQKNISFIDKFISTIKNDFVENEKFLLITGDISNIAEKNEFEAAASYISKITNELSISKDKIIIVPGDHDVHRDSIRNLLRDNSNATSEEINKAKFSNFSEFYFKIKEEEFCSNSIVIAQIEISPSILLLGLNSNLYIDQHGGFGKIDPTGLDGELKRIKDENEGKEVFLAFHHNISGMYENVISGQWEIENRKYIIEKINKHKLKILLYGNEHTPRSSKLEDMFYICEAGAVSGKKPLGTFRCYEIIESTEKLILKNNLFQLSSLDTVYETNGGVWNPIHPPSRFTTECDEFIILDNTNNTAQLEPELEIPEAESVDSIDISTSDLTVQNSDDNPIIVYDGEYSESIYEIIKKKKLFQSGHFHWSETSRAHNWIDITKLLEDRDDLFTVKSAVIDVIETFELNKDCDLIIGLGYEGNIISSKAAIKYNIPYSSLPYSYRYNDHHKFEKQLYYENEEKKFKNVMIITDVVNDGRTIRKLMKKDTREQIFFDNVDKVTVVSLFYSGDRPLNFDVLNTKGKIFPEDYDWENDYEDVDKINYYTVATLKVEKCPYNNSNYETDCLIYKDKLDCVHLFYDKSKT